MSDEQRDLVRPISRQALGRTAFLGSLYDATRDEFCERSIICDELPAVAIRSLDENHGHSSYEFDSAISKKLRKLNVDASLSLSLLGGLVKSVGASSNYLYTKEKTSQFLEATFIHRCITRTESLNVSHKEFKSRVEPNALKHKNATHVVTSIRWGADVFAQLEAKSATIEAKHQAKAGLKLELSKLLSNFVSVNTNSTSQTAKDMIPSGGSSTNPSTQIDNGTASPQISFDSNSTATKFNYKITLFGDLIPTTCPKTMDELFAILPTITQGLQKTNNGKGRPIEYLMLPISEVAEILNVDLISTRLFRAVEESITCEIHAIFDEIDRLRTIIHSLRVSIQKTEEFFFEDEINQVISHEGNIVRFEREIRERIGKILVKVRSAQAESNQLDQVLVELETQIANYRNTTKEIERGNLNQKVKYALELKDKGVIAIREPETLAVYQHRHPKHQLMVLYSSQELRSASKEHWIIAYFELLRRIEANQNTNNRVLYCYFDYDLNPSFQPQKKILQVKEYVGAPVHFGNDNSDNDDDTQLENRNQTDPASKAKAMVKGASIVAIEVISKWQKNAKARLDEIFAKSGSRILVPYAPSLAARNQIFERLRRNQINILLIGRTGIGKTTFKNILADPTFVPNLENVQSKTQFPIFEQYSLTGSDVILNFVDTPGLFQRTESTSPLPDNDTLMQLIDSYVRSKTQQLHFICFFISISVLLTAEDLNSVRAFFDYLGPEIRKNACLIVTHCESKKGHERENFCAEINRNLDLKALSSQMKQGVFFTGSINAKDWHESSNLVYKQFENVCSYRQKILDLFTKEDINPVDLTANVLAQKIKDQITARSKKHPN